MMNSNLLLPKHARIKEIAKLSGLSTATVDRVIHGREGVRKTTQLRVMQAKKAIESGKVPIVNRNKPWRIKIFLPDNAGPSTEYLAKCFQQLELTGNSSIECIFSRKLEPTILARKLKACINQGVDAIGVQALEDHRVKEAIEYLHSNGIPCISIVTGIDTPSVQGTIEIDNRSAGRTAGYLMGQFIQTTGEIAIISAGHLYRAHEEREMGFRAIIRRQFPKLHIISTVCGHDDFNENYQQVKNLLLQHPNLIGIYNVGGGVEGMIKAAIDSSISIKTMIITHNLTPTNKAFLMDGHVNIIIHQDMQLIATRTINALISVLEKKEHQDQYLPISVITRENITGFNFT
jgi:LacI family transcriptional regulator